MGEINKPDTDGLLKLLFMESNLDHFMKSDTTELLLPPFSEYITALSEKRQEVPERIINRAGLDRSYGHQLFSGRRNPSRDSVLQLAFGFEADYELAQEMLKTARKSYLHPRVKRDMIIIFCLQHHYSVSDTQIALDKYDLPLLGGGNRYE